MRAVGTGVAESFGAIFALERLVTRVNPDMFLQKSKQTADTSILPGNSNCLPSGGA